MWAVPTDEVARLAGIDPSQVLRFDQNTPPLPLPSTRPGTIAGALARVNGYPGGGYRSLTRANPASPSRRLRSASRSSRTISRAIDA